MSKQSTKQAAPRGRGRATPGPAKAHGGSPLHRDQIVTVALQLADAEGLKGVSMRKVADELGVEAMSLYHHLSGKQALLNAMVEHVYADVYQPRPRAAWRQEMERRCESMHAALLAHPWAAALMESAATGPCQQRLTEATLGCLAHAGFTPQLMHYALTTLDSFLYGFAFQENTWPVARAELPPLIATMRDDIDAEQFPQTLRLMDWVAALCRRPRPAHTSAQSTFPEAFTFGLTLQLDGLELALRKLSCS